MHAEHVETVTVYALGERRTVAHEPDDQFTVRLYPGIHRRVLQVGGFAVLFKDKLDLRMRLGARVKLAGPRGQFIALGCRIGKAEW